MTAHRSLRVLALSLTGTAILTSPSAGASESEPRAFCRHVPERADDFAWENDKVAFRSYGPALRGGKEDGGVDCWLKRVPSPVIDKWYRQEKEGKSYHTDHGEGYDPYHVGSSLGCGGLGLWIDGRLAGTETHVGWKVIEPGPEKAVFDLDYEWEHGGHTYTQTKRITIRLGDRLYRSQAIIRKDGEPAAGLPVAVGITTHDGKARARGDARQGWIACWEEIDGSGLGTGVVMDPRAVTEYKEVKSKTADESHALFLARTDDKGMVSWWAGYGWERAGEIRNAGDWTKYLKGFPAGK